MNFEAEMLISILKLTREGSVSREIINKNTRIPKRLWSKLIQTLQNERLIYVHEGFIQATSPQRLELAVQAMKKGAGIETVTDLLQWREFEAMAGIAFENNDYSVAKNFRFKQGNRRFEIDVVGWKGPLVICVDCKHWHHQIGRSTLGIVAKAQAARVISLSQRLRDFRNYPEPLPHGSLKLIPVVLSFMVESTRFYDGVPIVPILQMQDFLNQVPAYQDSMIKVTPIGSDTQLSHQRKLF